MKLLPGTFILFFGLLMMSFSTMTIAGEQAYAVPAVRGFDLVSYHTGMPVMGSGHHAAEHDGITYLFSSKENKAMFVADAGKYLPAYGGYCAFGASVGKKFFADPTVWKIVEGKLYLNLDEKIKSQWVIDIPTSIAAADEHWNTIKDLPWAEANKL